MTPSISSLREQTWFDARSYPFASHTLSHADGTIHYVDEGQGEVILFVHGTPTWSFLYRQFITAFSATHRCIALDHLGFGLSDKPPGLDGSPKAHSERLEALIEHLGLEQVNLVVHDFGGPIGLGWAMRQPEKVQRIVLFNTWLWNLRSLPSAKQADRIINSWLGRFLYLHLNASPRLLLPQGFADKQKLTKALHHQYLRVFSKASDRHGLLQLGQSLLGSSDWYDAQWQQRDKLARTEMLMLWGEKDRFLPLAFREKWEQAFPQAISHSFTCGHFVQEEAAEASIAAMKGFFAGG